MIPSLRPQTEQRQQHALSPRLQHAVRLLQLSSLDFAHEVHGLLASNPFLESDDLDPALCGESGADSDADDYDGAAHAAEPQPPHASEPASQVSSGPDGDAATDTQAGAYDDAERELWQSGDRPGAGATHDGGGEFGALDFMAVQTSLATHLHTQIDVLVLAERDRLLAKALIESLDDDGYLRFAPEELADQLQPTATPQELRVALHRVQALEPAGVGARSVAECLLLQLAAIEDPAERELARQIVSEHLDRLAARDVPGLARRLRTSATSIERVCDRIRRLDPRPGWRYSSGHAAYIQPDVIVKKVQGAWAVTLNPAVVPRLRLNQSYAQLFQSHRSGHDGELAVHLQEARWAVHNVEQRFATILSVAQAIVRHQHRFFDFGAMAMRPLGLRAIADEVGLHESTVSRVTNNKYMATPLGVFELKHFFSRALATSNGKQVSGTAIRGLIKEIIAAEPPQTPLSDPEIARRLAQQGLIVARRTVTKYRQCLGIEAVDRRVRYAKAVPVESD